MLERPQIQKERKDNEGKWTDATKYRICKSIVIYQNKRLTAEMSGVPLDTINKWTGEPWWDNLIREIRIEQKSILAGKMAGIVDKALFAVQDRLLNGEAVVIQKTGEIVKKPVSLKDAQRVVTDLVQKQLQLEESIASGGQNVQSIADSLKQLANEFAKFNRSKPETEVIDVEVVDVSSKEIT